MRRKPTIVIIASIAPSILSIGFTILFFILKYMVTGMTKQMMIVGLIVASLLIVGAMVLLILALIFALRKENKESD
jgi:hypothetical protein